MNPSLLVVPVLAVFLTGCARQDPNALAVSAPATAPSALPNGAGAPHAPPGPATTVLPGEPAPVPFVGAVDHDFFPLEAGVLLVYEGESEGQQRRDEVRVLAETREIAGIDCTTVYQEVFLDGALSEVTREWFAQDESGNIWKFGESSLELRFGLFLPSSDSWVAGANGALPWKFLSASPVIGEVYTENRPDGRDTVQVVSLAGVASVPAGTFANCLEVVENADDPDDTDLILYAPGVGAVQETSTNGKIVLVSAGRE